MNIKLSYGKEGIDVEVIDLMTIRPMDTQTIIKSVQKTNRLVVLEESFPFSSISSEIAFRVQRHAFDYLDAPVLRVTQSDTPFPFSLPLLEEASPNVEKLIRAIKEVMYLVK